MIWPKKFKFFVPWKILKQPQKGSIISRSKLLNHIQKQAAQSFPEASCSIISRSQLHKSQSYPEAVLISRVMYASPAWWGFTDASDGQRLQSIINKAVKQGFLSPAQVPLIELCQQADETLFSGILRNTNHVLHCLLPPEQQTGYTLRPRAHDRSRLPGDVNPLLRKNFIYRSLSDNFFYSN